MTRLQWSTSGFDLISGPSKSGRLAALRAAAERVNSLIEAGTRDVIFSRVDGAYVVISSGGVVEQFPYNLN